MERSGAVEITLRVAAGAWRHPRRLVAPKPTPIPATVDARAVLAVLEELLDFGADEVRNAAPRGAGQARFRSRDRLTVFSVFSAPSERALLIIVSASPLRLGKGSSETRVNSRRDHRPVLRERTPPPSGNGLRPGWPPGRGGSSQPSPREPGSTGKEIGACTAKGAGARTSRRRGSAVGATAWPRSGAPGRAP